MKTDKSPSRLALLLIDVINDMDFPEADRLLVHALPAARRIAKLKQRARQAGLPTIYVNDNFGRWRSDFRGQVEHCSREQCAGREIAMLLLPDKDDYFVLKPMHSGFYASPLHILLQSLRINSLILTGFATDICVLYTANDAYMRGYKLIVATDCVAAESSRANRNAIGLMQRNLKAKVCLGGAIRLGKVG